VYWPSFSVFATGFSASFSFTSSAVLRNKTNKTKGESYSPESKRKTKDTDLYMITDTDTHTDTHTRAQTLMFRSFLYFVCAFWEDFFVLCLCFLRRLLNPRGQNGSLQVPHFCSLSPTSRLLSLSRDLFCCVKYI